ncbi:hypothetical protein [Capnocytophaga gingivalis]|uniref:hypothetical protein n=1 Tax=Capnocytophaga gingivalis TaxID=1017 RepID=UPI0028D1152B|nr:hypothetical protein [Capnocytophaga gingivalis]
MKYRNFSPSQGVTLFTGIKYYLSMANSTVEEDFDSNGDLLERRYYHLETGYLALRETVFPERNAIYLFYYGYSLDQCMYFTLPYDEHFDRLNNKTED